MKGKKHLYQITTVLAPKLEDKQRDEVVAKVVSKIEEMEAKVAKKDHMGAKALEYKIKGFDKGDFWVMEVESEKPMQIREFNLFLNREVNIIRYLIINK